MAVVAMVGGEEMDEATWWMEVMVLGLMGNSRWVSGEMDEARWTRMIKKWMRLAHGWMRWWICWMSGVVW